MDGVAQIFSHWTAVAFASNYSTMRAVTGVSAEVLDMEVLRAKGLPCMQAAAFSGDPDGGSTTYVSLNRCDRAVQTTWPSAVPEQAQAAATVSQTIYSATPGNAGEYVMLSAIQNVDRPPWRNGPLQPTTSSRALLAQEKVAATIGLEAPPLSLSFVRIN